jgi:hypothetical protein
MFANNPPTTDAISAQTADMISMKRVKVKVKFALEQATKAQRWSRSIAILFP